MEFTTMNKTKAIKIAVKCIRFEARKLLDYHLRYQESPGLWPDCKNSSRRYTEMQEAISLLEGLISHDS
jgi:hypothetical protein